MENLATQQILEAVEQARIQKQQAVSTFNEQKRAVKHDASMHNYRMDEIDRAVELIARVSRITDELYSAYEAIVFSLDRICQPLVNDNVEAKAIKAVWDCIKELNEDSSGISSHINGSIDGRGIGNLRTEKYSASIQAKTIEKIWAAKYAALPEVIEEKKRLAEAAEQRKKELRQYLEKINAERIPRRVAIKNECEEIRKKREELVIKLKEDEKKKAAAVAKNDYEKEMHETDQSLSNLKKELADLESKLSSLKFYELFTKMQLNEQIKTVKSNIGKVDARREHAKRVYDSSSYQIQTTLQQKYSEFVKLAEKKLPFPSDYKTANVDFTMEMEIAYYAVRMIMCAWPMQRDLEDYNELTKELTHSQMRIALNSLVRAGLVEEAEDGEGIHYIIPKK